MKTGMKMPGGGEKGREGMSTQKQKDKKQMWVRVLCIVLAILMIGSSLVAALSLF